MMTRGPEGGFHPITEGSGALTFSHVMNSPSQSTLIAPHWFVPPCNKDMV